MKSSVIAAAIVAAFLIVPGAASARASKAVLPSPSADAAAASASAPGTPQRSKMKACNAEAKTKDVHGADRRAFMKQCLSAKGKPADAS